MTDSKIYLRDEFFKFLVSLEELKEKKDKELFLSSIGITDEVFNLFKKYLLNFKIDFNSDELYIYPINENKKINLELSVSEWFALQSMMSLEKETKIYSFKLLKNKIEEVHQAYNQYNLSKKMMPEHHEKNADELDSILSKLDFFIIKRCSVDLVLTNHNQCRVFPLRVTYLDGELCLICESYNDKILNYFAIDDIEVAKEFKDEALPNIGQIEVNEFINHLRMINGNEERLILKIYSPGDMDLLPKHHFLGNPFVSSNDEGDMIWAASIEMCEDVFKWLYMMKDHVEILDPGHLKKEFSHYCEMKKIPAENKKAS